MRAFVFVGRGLAGYGHALGMGVLIGCREASRAYEEEPVLGGGHPLLQLPNAVYTPHLGYVEWGAKHDSAVFSMRSWRSNTADRST